MRPSLATAREGLPQAADFVGLLWWCRASGSESRRTGSALYSHELGSVDRLRPVPVPGSPWRPVGTPQKGSRPVGRAADIAGSRRPGTGPRPGGLTPWRATRRESPTCPTPIFIAYYIRGAPVGAEGIAGRTQAPPPAVESSNKPRSGPLSGRDACMRGESPAVLSIDPRSDSISACRVRPWSTCRQSQSRVLQSMSGPHGSRSGQVPDTDTPTSLGITMGSSRTIAVATQSLSVCRARPGHPDSTPGRSTAREAAPCAVTAPPATTHNQPGQGARSVTSVEFAHSPPLDASEEQPYQLEAQLPRTTAYPARRFVAAAALGAGLSDAEMARPHLRDAKDLLDEGRLAMPIEGPHPQSVPVRSQDSRRGPS